MKNALPRAKPILSFHFTEGGLTVKSILGRSIVLIALLVIVPLSAMAQQYKIDKPIFGFYLGESKQSLLQRAKQEGITYTAKGKISGQTFPDGYIFDSSMNKSNLVKFVVLSFCNDYLGQINIYFNDLSNERFVQMAQVLGESWSIAPTFSEETYGSSYVFEHPDLAINLIHFNSAPFGYQTCVVYLHSRLFDVAKQALAKDQF
jgi:hypothetical protein